MLISLALGFQRLLQHVDDFRNRKLQRQDRFYWLLLTRHITPDWLTNSRGIVAGLQIIFFIGVAVTNYDPKFDLAVRVGLLFAFTFGCITDLIDGPMARWMRDKNLPLGGKGVHRDPLFDKLLTYSVALFYTPMNGWALRVIMLVSLLGDATGTITRARAEKKDMKLSSNIFGKAKMVFFCLALFAEIACFPRYQELTLVFATVSVTLGMVSLLMHRNSWRAIREAQRIVGEVTQGTRK